MSLRLGVMCAVIDASGCVLLSRRGDLDIWTLPGGRLDMGERLQDAARREVEEETGISAGIERAVGLFYLADWRRVNVLYAGYPVGGRLRDQTRETRANRYFTDGSLPQTVIGAKEALAASLPPERVIASTRAELWRLKLRFGKRWLVNRMSGHPEPRFPVFDVRAVAVVLGADSRRVLTLPRQSDSAAVSYRALPRVACDGSAAPWDQLGAKVQPLLGAAPDFRWVGLWEDSERAMIEFVFAATASDRILPDNAEWTATRNGAFSDRDMSYIERVRPSYARDPIWSMAAQADLTDIITLDKEAKL